MCVCVCVCVCFTIYKNLNLCVISFICFFCHADI